MTVKELLSFRRKNGLLEKVTVWKSCNENANEYEKIAEFNPGFYEAVSKEILDLEIENYDIDFNLCINDITFKDTLYKQSALSYLIH